MYSYDSRSLNDNAKRTYDLEKTYEGNRTINLTLVILYLVGNKYRFCYYCTCITKLLCYSARLLTARERVEMCRGMLGLRRLPLPVQL